MSKQRFWILDVSVGPASSPWYRTLQRTVAETATLARLGFRSRSYSRGEPLERLIDVYEYRPHVKAHWLAEPRS